MRQTRRQFLQWSAGACVAAVLAGCRGAWTGSRARPLAWGGPGRREGHFSSPRAIAAHGGEVFVIDRTGRVQVFSQNGKFRRLWSTPDYRNGTPTGLTFGSDGSVIVPDTHYSQILIYDRDGKLLERWGEYGDQPGRFIYPTDIACIPGGAWYICEYGLNADRIQVFDAEHRRTGGWGGTGEAPGQFNRAMGIELSSRNELFVADTANHRVQCFDLAGKPLRVIARAGTGPGCIKFPYQIALAPDDSVLVCEYGNHRISRFRADGAFVASVGEPGRGPGQFNGPRGVAVSEDGWVFVADTDNNRIQRFSLEAWS